ncbi:hypothetical protein JHK85_051884 [Glycine max]|nr:hypothetical protein JHK85_051884 [Glycine max]KHN40678.1 hypothetical protein glysoja_001176 [Glycine soja]
MESSSGRESTGRVPLSGVVRCTVMAMVFPEMADVIGLGMKGRIWLTKVSRVRSSVWKVGGKRPGYNASDSESDELEEDS